MEQLDWKPLDGETEPDRPEANESVSRILLLTSQRESFTKPRGVACATELRKGCDNDLGGVANEPRRHSNCAPSDDEWLSQIGSRQQFCGSNGHSTNPKLTSEQVQVSGAGEKKLVGRRYSEKPRRRSRASSSELARERCGSGTSDYFTSSSHNSPSIAVAHLKSGGSSLKKQQTQVQVLARYPAPNQQSARTTIYENPAFARDAYESAQVEGANEAANNGADKAATKAPALLAGKSKSERMKPTKRELKGRVEG